MGEDDPVKLPTKLLELVLFVDNPVDSSCPPVTESALMIFRYFTVAQYWMALFPQKALQQLYLVATREGHLLPHYTEGS
jgi:hypothetical protein